jgi:hypothetical protein
VRKLLTLTLIAVALLGAAAIGYHLLDSRWREWNRQVEEAQEWARAETARADSAVSESDRERARADSLAAIPSVLDTIAIDTILVAAPDTCAPLVAIIEELVDENARLRMAYDTLSSAAGRLRVSYDDLLVVNDSLMTVLDNRPIPPPKWLPSFQVGPQVGAGPDGFYYGVGISISWEIPIP